MELESQVLEEFGKIGLPQSFEVDVRPYSEVYPNSPEILPKTFIQISIGSSAEDKTHDSMCSYLDFWYNTDEKRIEDVNFKLQNPLKGQGLGRSLVQTMEQVGRNLGCTSSRINVNTNPSFWEYMGYVPKGEYWEKSI